MGGEVAETILSLVRHNVLTSEAGTLIISSAAACGGAGGTGEDPPSVVSSQNVPVASSKPVVKSNPLNNVSGSSKSKSSGKSKSSSSSKMLLQSQATAGSGSELGRSHRHGRARRHRFLRARGTIATAGKAVACGLELIGSLVLGTMENRSPCGAPAGLRALAEITGGLARDGSATASTEEKAVLPTTCLVGDMLAVRARQLALAAIGEDLADKQAGREQLFAPIVGLLDDIAGPKVPSDQACKDARAAFEQDRLSQPSESINILGIDAPKTCTGVQVKQHIEDAIEKTSTPGVLPAGKLDSVFAVASKYLQQTAKTLLDDKAAKAIGDSIKQLAIKTELQESTFFPELDAFVNEDLEEDPPAVSSSNGGAQGGA